jgi:hypothetical protein
MRRTGGYLRLITRGPATRPGLVRVRQVVNVVNLSTVLGLVVALAGRCRLRRGPYGIIIATGYRLPFPRVTGRAMTIGDVVLIGLDDAAMARRPGLLEHEARHCAQYARWLGPLGFLPAYGLASAWSWWHTGNPALRNRFEARAGLVDGGYASLPE